MFCVDNDSKVGEEGEEGEQKNRGKLNFYFVLIIPCVANMPLYEVVN